jgi:two-component system CheB/CheR fusion protein
MTSNIGQPRVPVVAIGASAGGIKALQQFFDRIPNDTGACFVVIVHLAPDYESHLAEIIGTRSTMPAATVEGGAELQPNHIFVIPPNRQLQITDHEITTFEFKEARGRRAPIDFFFRSFAEQRGDGFAVILTGAGTVGSVGAKAVKEGGGIVLVQDPLDAEYGSMPRSAIAMGIADIVLPIPQLADQLVTLIREKMHMHEQAEDEAEDDFLKRILGLLRARTGHDFSHYKRSTVMRRIARRMQLARKETLAEYFEYARTDTEEAQALFSDLLISVTTFFRDPAAFDRLAVEVIPRLFEDKDASSTVRVWCAGCATGEEAYSIAMLLFEEAARRELPAELQIFATDLDIVALSTAREGCYPTAIEADVSEARLRRFFVREGQSYRVKRELRDAVVLATHSLVKDVPFSRLDLVSCRNLLIYLDRNLQQQVISTLNYALLPGGYLFLGASESADNPPGLFRSIHSDARIYKSIERTSDRLVLLPRVTSAPRFLDRPKPLPKTTLTHSEATQHRQVLEELAPPSILVDEGHHIIHLSETAGRYLLHPAGTPTTEVTELVRPELRIDLRAALYRALEQGQSSLSLPISVQFNGTSERVYVQVKSVTARDHTRTALVIFIEGSPIEKPASGESVTADEGQSFNIAIQQLHDELNATRARLKASHEEEEAANEELRAANEELQSINEEYRSTAEELETSKEELQSFNEELQTLNHELKAKLESISRAHNDLQNLMAATDVGTLFLDNRLQIKRFTPGVAEIFNITAGDEGRSITDFTHRLDYDGLPADSEEILRTLIPIEREVHSQNGSWFLMRLRPYRTVEDKIEGVVVTFVDVTQRREAEEALRTSEERLKLARQASDLGMYDYNAKTQRCWWDQRARALWDMDVNEQVTMDLVWSRVHPDDRDTARIAFEEALDPNGDGVYSAEFRLRPDHPGDERWIKANGKAFFSGAGSGRQAERLVATIQDITDHKAWEASQRLLLNELSHRVKNTLAVVQAMARQTMRQAKNPKSALVAFEGRLNALSRSHDLLVTHNWRGAELSTLIRSQIGGQVTEDHDRVTLDGPSLILPAHLATPFGLLFHELATNASKHGALTTETGTVRLTWGLHQKGEKRVLEVVWSEMGGSRPNAAGKPGFGSYLIEHGLPGAKVTRTYRDDGLVCMIEVVLDDVGERS